MMDIVVLGQFEVTSGKLRVTDPCYDRSVWCSGYVDAENGTWNALITTADTELMGRRVARLVVWRQVDTQLGETAPIADQPVDFEVGVDSGQAGFFDDAFYPDNCEEGDFYGKCGDFTLSKQMGGVLPFGAVSRSGFGDGGYDCFVGRNEKGNVVSAQIVFITPEELSFEDEV